jgi:hypothetical protein
MPSGIYVRTIEMNERQSKIMTGKLTGDPRLSRKGKLNSQYGKTGENAPNYNPKNYILETRICVCGCSLPFECSLSSKKRFIKGHGRIGKIFSEEALKLMSEARKGEKHPNFGKSAYPGSGYGKSGKRKDLNNQSFRSTWDANVTRIFNYEGIPSEYECKRFPLIRADGSKTSYLPDHHIVGTHIWYEQKGYMRSGCLEKITLFREQYPNEILIVIGPEEYKRFKESYKDLIPNWE